MFGLFNDETEFAALRRTLVLISLLTVIASMYPVALVLPTWLLPVNSAAVEISRGELLCFLLGYQVYLAIRALLVYQAYVVAQKQTWFERHFHVPRPRPPDRRNPDPHRNHEPLLSPRQGRDRGYRLKGHGNGDRQPER